MKEMKEIKEIKEIDSKARTTSKASGVKKGTEYTGTSWSSQHFVYDYLGDIGKIRSVEACGNGLDIGVEMNEVRIKGSTGILRPMGFNIGYRGAGPTKLIETLSEIGIDTTDNLEKIIYDKENYYKCVTIISKNLKK